MQSSTVQFSNTPNFCFDGCDYDTQGSRASCLSLFRHSENRTAWYRFNDDCIETYIASLQFLSNYNQHISIYLSLYITYTMNDRLTKKKQKTWDLWKFQFGISHLHEIAWKIIFETISRGWVGVFFFFPYSKNFWIGSALGAKHRLRTISHKYRKNRWQHLGIITMSQNCRNLPNAAGSLGKTLSFSKDSKWW